jgi:cytochrome P450
MTENKDHHRLRAHLLAGYAGKGLQNQEQLVDEQILRYIRLIEQKYISTPGDPRPMDMSRTTQYLTQDLVSSVGFGKAFGYLDADDDIFGVIEVSEALLAPLAITALFPIFLAVIKSPFMKPFLPKPTDKHGMGRMLGIIKSHVDTRYGASKTSNNDVLQSFVESGLPRDEVEAESLIQLVGGTDSTATAIRNIIFFVSTSPTAYKKLQEEIDGAASADEPVITDRRAKTLPYLQAVIREGLRMWPPISGLMPRMSDQDEVVCGVRIPARTNVAWAVSGIMRDKASFGPDANSFDPDRWINAEPERLKVMEAAQGLVFMSGSRWECLGKRLAYIELGKIIFEVSCHLES